jgi:GT2 family glycosyltransferase
MHFGQFEEWHMTQPTYSVVVLYYKLGMEITLTVDALAKQVHLPVEIVVIDNNSRDNVLNSCLRDWPVKIIENKINGGYAYGMNQGCQALSITTDYVLFVTHETKLDPEAANNLIIDAERTGAAVVGPTLLRNSTMEVWSHGGRVTRLGQAKHLAAPTKDGLCDWLDGAALMVRTEVFKKINGFNQNFFLYWEDLDFCSRAREYGAVICSPNTVALQDTKSMPTFYGIRNRILYWRMRNKKFAVFMAVLSASLRALKCLVMIDLYKFGQIVRGVTSGFTTVKVSSS